MSFCKYKNIFGEPKLGLHKYRLFDIAIVDVVATLWLAYMINIYLYPDYCYHYILLILFCASIVLHKLFCVDTTVTKFVFG